VITLPRSFVRDIISHALQDDPIECCGIIAGSGKVATKLYRAKNAEASPYRYSVDSKEMLLIFREIENNGWAILAIYHSHTGTRAYPSETDVRLAAWPDAHYLIVSLANAAAPILRSFRILDSVIKREKLRVLPDP
jgi:proteasome lid subunit RPN8/RPN11